MAGERPPKITDISKAICQSISMRSEKRFTGELNVHLVVNFNGGGITAARFEREAEIEKIKIKGAL